MDLQRDQQQRDREAELVNQARELQATIDIVQSNYDKALLESKKFKVSLSQKDEQL